MDREDVGLRFLLAGMGLGMALMTFVVASDATPFFQAAFAPTTTEAMRPLGFALDGAVCVSLGMIAGGIACFSGSPRPAAPDVAAPRLTAEDRPADVRRRKAERARKARAPHGST